jgi:sugar/nucleoside kinase (ribokinase family)
LGALADSEIDYLAIGHVTIDVIADAEAGQRRQPGGGAFYSALQAARLGLRTGILTAGAGDQLQELLEPYSDELTIEVAPAPATTTLATYGTGAQRKQRLLAWAGVVPAPAKRLACGVLHLAPVARELAPAYPIDAGFVGLTPQGLIRSWERIGDPIRTSALAAEDLPMPCDAAVLSSDELSSCEPLLSGARLGHAPTIAITAGPEATTLRLPDGSSERVVPIAVDPVHDDLGAGDVFAAAFFVALAGGSTPATAARFGNAAAAVRLAARGPGAIGDRAAIEALLEETAP